MSNQAPVRDLVLVGSRPDGCTAAIDAARAGLSPDVVAGWFTDTAPPVPAAAPQQVRA
jgi:thioredoxin reductase